MNKFKTKPVIKEAIQWTGDNLQQIRGWAKTVGASPERIGQITKTDKLVIETLEGDHRALKGDWIICGLRGELYPCKPDIFEQTYERSE